MAQQSGRDQARQRYLGALDKQQQFIGDTYSKSKREQEKEKRASKLDILTPMANLASMGGGIGALFGNPAAGAAIGGGAGLLLGGYNNLSNGGNLLTEGIMDPLSSGRAIPAVSGAIGSLGALAGPGGFLEEKPYEGLSAEQQLADARAAKGITPQGSDTYQRYAAEDLDKWLKPSSDPSSWGW